jgi:hypothetical protein
MKLVGMSANRGVQPCCRGRIRHPLPTPIVLEGNWRQSKDPMTSRVTSSLRTKLHHDIKSSGGTVRLVDGLLAFAL